CFCGVLLREPDASTIEVPRTWVEFETLVVTDGWRSLLRGRSKSVLERDVLPAFLGSRRWYAERGNPLTTHVVGLVQCAAAESDWGVALLEVRGRREPANYLLPLTIKWTRLDRERQNPSALAAVRRGPREGSLLDATADPGFVALVLENLRAARTIEADQRRIEFAPTASFPKDVLVAIKDVRAVDTEQSNTTVLVGTDYVVKLFRRRERGPNPEIEVGHFLTEPAAFPHAPPLLGTVEMEENGAHSAVAVVHGFVQNQGDAWAVTNAYLDRFVEEQRLLMAEAAGHSDEQAAYLRLMDHVGRRV